jgi:hypothetical protein
MVSAESRESEARAKSFTTEPRNDARILAAQPVLSGDLEIGSSGDRKNPAVSNTLRAQVRSKGQKLKAKNQELAASS